MNPTAPTLFFCALALAACSAAPGDEPTGTSESAMIRDRENACSGSQLAGGYEDVDGVCLLTCWNCPGWQGGGGGSVPGGCHTPRCDGPSGGGGAGGGGLPDCPPGDPGYACASRCDDTFFTCLQRCEAGGTSPGTCFTRCERARGVCERGCERRNPRCASPVGR